MSIISCPIPRLPAPNYSRKRPRDTVLYVYAVLRRDTGEVKIGVADDIRARLTVLQTGSAGVLELCLAKIGTVQEEIDLHERFAAHRIMGEWFRYCDEIRDWIAAEVALVPNEPLPVKPRCGAPTRTGDPCKAYANQTDRCCRHKGL